MFLQLLWNRFRRPSLTLLVIPHPKPSDVIRTSPPDDRLQVVEVRVELSFEKKTRAKTATPRVKQREDKRGIGSQRHPKTEIVDCLALCPNCGYSRRRESKRTLKDGFSEKGKR